MVPLAPAGPTSAPGTRSAGQRARTPPATPRRRHDLRDSRNTLVHATSRLVGVVGLDDVVVVETPDAVLVADRSRSQDVKHIVGELRTRRRSEDTLHRQVHRPGAGTTASTPAPRFQVKRIMVKPGAALSLQMHHHRAEHWIVVGGHRRGHLRRPGKMLLTENQSTYIPLGEMHRLANPGRSRSRSSRCSPAATSARTTSCASRTPTAAKSGVQTARRPSHDPRHRRRRLHRQQLRARLARTPTGEPVRQPRRAHLRRQPAKPAPRWRATRATSSCTATSATARCSIGCWPSTGRARSCTSPPRATSTARSTARPPSCRPTWSARFTLLEAARAYWAA